MDSNKRIDESTLEEIFGGRTLPENWEKTADMYAAVLKNKYGNLTYEEACAKLREFFTDEDDLALLYEYIKKFYPEFQN